MKSDYSAAKQYIFDEIDSRFKTETFWHYVYQGMIDVTIFGTSLQTMPEEYGLTSYQYNMLVNQAQKYADKKLKDWCNEHMTENERIAFKTGIPISHLEK